MKKSRLGIWAILLVIVCSSSAFAWGPATHTYIINKLQSTGVKADQMYGALTPDINLLLSSANISPYFTATHYDFMNVWTAAQNSGSDTSVALAYGFVSHNEMWGADYSAHIRSFTYPDFQQGGYVIKKSQDLCGLLISQVGGDLGGLINNDNCHFILEYGIDLMVKMQDPAIGAKIKQSARHRRPEISALLMAAYPDNDPSSPYGLSYGTEFAGAEQVWREKMIQYGDIMMLPDAKVVPALAAFLNQMAHDLKILPDGMDATSLIYLALLDSIAVCGPDLGPELQATISNVGVNMLANDVRYSVQPKF